MRSISATMQPNLVQLHQKPGPTADPLFTTRWSPRAFLPDPIRREDLLKLFDAARHAPSSFNEQPWLFLYATTPEDRDRFLSILLEGNRTWTRQVPVLAFLLARKRSSRTGEINPMSHFDAGSAWMSLALQARMLGLDTHAMGGIDRERAYEVLGVPRDEFDVLVGIAIGKRADARGLPAALAQREGPSPRKPIGDVAREGRLPSPPVEA